MAHIVFLAALLPLAAAAAPPALFTLNASATAQVILGLGFEIQSASIGSGNHGLPNATTSVPWDLVPAERSRFYSDMLQGFRLCRLALGLYFRGLTPDRAHMVERWPGQAAALAPNLALLSLDCVGIGLGSSLGQNVVPMTAEYSPAENRARTLGTVLMGMFFGILFARLTGGLIAASLGWRWSFVLAALLCLLLAPALWRILPSSTPRTRMPYWSLIASLFGILGRYAELRRVAANQFFIGISYGGFWSTVAPMLLAFHALGPSEAGLMAIPGAAGVLISRAAGRWSDRSGASIVATAALCSVLLSFSVLELAAHWLLAVVLEKDTEIFKQVHSVTQRLFATYKGDGMSFPLAMASAMRIRVENPATFRDMAAPQKTTKKRRS
jgi:MFS family permease